MSFISSGNYVLNSVWHYSFRLDMKQNVRISQKKAEAVDCFTAGTSDDAIRNIYTFKRKNGGDVVGFESCFVNVYQL